ncbi:F-box protein [Raphanus sativus]|nr:F-box protein [Raphanus sativus]
MYVYSSETGRWAFKQLRTPVPLQEYGFDTPLNLDGMVYVWDKRVDNDTGPGVLVVYDFYAEKGDDNQCRIIPLPGTYNKYVRRCLTASCGDVIYVEILYQRLKVWKLKSNNSDGEWWQLTREEIDMVSVGFDVLCFPLGMNPFDTDLIYLWSRQHRCVVSGNLRTQEFTLHREAETWSDGEVCAPAVDGSSALLVHKDV